MIELIRSEDAVFVSWLEMRLGELGIKPHVLDAYTSSAYAGALSAVRFRVMVGDEEIDRARRALDEAERLAADGRADG